MIVVMFDAHKLDISDELKMVIDTLKPHHDKMRYNSRGRGYRTLTLDYGPTARVLSFSFKSKRLSVIPGAP